MNHVLLLLESGFYIMFQYSQAESECGNVLSMYSVWFLF